MAGEVGRVAVVIEVEQVGDQEHRPAFVDDLACQPPRLGRVGGRAQPQRRAGQLQKALLEAAGPAVGEPRRRQIRGCEVVEAGARAEAEGELLGDRGAMERQQVPQRGRAAVVPRQVRVAGDGRRNLPGRHPGQSVNRRHGRRYSSRTTRAPLPLRSADAPNRTALKSSFRAGNRRAGRAAPTGCGGAEVETFAIGKPSRPRPRAPSGSWSPAATGRSGPAAAAAGAAGLPLAVIPCGTANDFAVPLRHPRRRAGLRAGGRTGDRCEQMELRGSADDRSSTWPAPGSHPPRPRRRPG